MIDKGPGQEPKYNGFAEITKDTTDSVACASFEQRVIDTKNESELSKYVTDGGKEGVHVLLHRLSPEVLLSLFGKISISVLRKIALEMADEEKNALYKKMGTVKNGRERVVSLEKKANCQLFPKKDEQELIDLGIREGDLEEIVPIGVKDETPGAIGNPAEFVFHKEETVPRKVALSDEEEETIFTPDQEKEAQEAKKIYEKAEKLIADIEKMGYIIIPSALEKGKKIIGDLTFKKTEEIILDLEVLKTIIRNAKAETARKIKEHETFESGIPIISDTVSLGGYELVPIKKNADNSVPDLDITQDIEVATNFGKYLKNKYPERFK